MDAQDCLKVIYHSGFMMRPLGAASTQSVIFTLLESNTVKGDWGSDLGAFKLCYCGKYH